MAQYNTLPDAKDSISMSKNRRFTPLYIIALKHALLPHKTYTIKT